MARLSICDAHMYLHNVGIDESVTYGRNVTWTITIYLRADGEFMNPQLILRGETIDTNNLEFVMRNNIRVTCTPKVSTIIFFVCILQGKAS